MDIPGSVNFDFDSLDAELTGADYSKLVMAIEALQDWIFQIEDGQLKGMASGNAIRAHVWLWITRPQLCNANEEEMAAMIGVSKASLNRMVTSFRRCFGITTRHMRSPDARKAFQRGQFNRQKMPLIDGAGI